MDVKAVIQALFEFTDKSWVTSTRVEKLALMAGADVKTVRARLHALEAAGGISIHYQSKDGRQTSNRWVIHPARLVAAALEVSETARASRLVAASRAAQSEGATTVDGTPALPSTVDQPSRQRDPRPTADGTPPLPSTGGEPYRRRETIRGSDLGKRSGEEIRGNIGGAAPLPPVHLGADLGPCQVCGHIVAAGCRHGITGSLFEQRPSEAAQTPQATTDLALVPPKAPRAKPAPAKGIANPEVARVWEAYRVHHPRAGSNPTKGWAVAEAVEMHGADVMALVVDWAHLSEDSAAQFLRDTGNTGETLFRPQKRLRFVEAAIKWEQRGRLAAPMTAGRQLSAREETNNDVDQWLANNRKPQRDVIEAEEPKWIR